MAFVLHDVFAVPFGTIISFIIDSSRFLTLDLVADPGAWNDQTGAAKGRLSKPP